MQHDEQHDEKFPLTREGPTGKKNSFTQVM